MSRWYDLSVPLVDGGVSYPGNPAIRIAPWKDIARGDSSNITSLAMGTHSGTHVDAPLHMIANGGTVDQISLDVLIGPALVLDLPPEARVIEVDMLRRPSLDGIQRVLLKTRNSTLLHRGEFDSGFTYLAPDAAEYLVAEGIRLVGTDYYSIEQFHSGHHRTHLALLGAGVVIVEGLDLAETPPGVYDFICLPLRLAGLDGAPARVVLRSR